MKIFSRFWKSKAEPELTLEASRALHRTADTVAREEIPMPETPAGPAVAELEPDPQHPEIEASSEPEVRSATDEDTQTRRDRERALADPLYLANQVLGFELQPEHEILLSAMSDERFRDALVLWPRGAGKTSCLSVVIVQTILKNRNRRIVYATSDADLAKRRFAQVADFFRNPTPNFRRLFPDVELESCKGTEFVVSGRSDRAVIDPSFLATTIRTDNVGSRFDLLILDDVVSESNAISENSRENTFTRYQLFRGLRSGSARIVLCGTVYHPEDTYGRVRAAVEAEGDNTSWCVDVRSVWRYKCMHCTHKDLFHDATGCSICRAAGHDCKGFERGEKTVLIDAHKTKSGEIFGYTIAGLEQESGDSRMGLANFKRQLELDARPEVTTQWPKFTREFLRAHTIDTSNLNLRAAFIVCDLGLRGSVPNGAPPPPRLVNSTDHDATVLLAIALHGTQAIPIDCDSGEWGAATLAQRVLAFIKKHSGYPSVPFFSENIGSWDSIRLNIETLASRENVKIDLRNIGNSNVENAKLRRIAELHRAMTAGRVGLPAFMPGLGSLCPQLLAYPHQVQGHDDYADCLSLAPLVLDSGIEAVTGARFTPTFHTQDLKPNWSDLQSRIRWNRRNGFSDTGSDSDGDSDDGGSGVCM